MEVEGPGAAGATAGGCTSRGPPSLLGFFAGTSTFVVVMSSETLRLTPIEDAEGVGIAGPDGAIIIGWATDLLAPGLEARTRFGGAEERKVPGST